MRKSTPWRQSPTDRQKAISERLSEKVKEETGVIVDAETARAVRWTALRWSERSLFDSPSELENLTALARYERRKDYALKLLREAEDELNRFLKSSDNLDYEYGDDTDEDDDDD